MAVVSVGRTRRKLAWEGQVHVRTTYLYDKKEHAVWEEDVSVCSWVTMTELTRAAILETDYDCGYEVYPVEVSAASATRTAIACKGAWWPT